MSRNRVVAYIAVVAVWALIAFLIHGSTEHGERREREPHLSCWERPESSPGARTYTCSDGRLIVVSEGAAWTWTPQ